MSAAVLIVDDDDDLRVVIRELLEDEGYVVDEARNGDEALRLLKGAPKGIVVLFDLNMPVLDGMGVVNAISGDKSLKKRHAFILATADNRTLPLWFVQQLSSLEIPILSKPFEEGRLFALVATAAARLKAR